MILQASSGGIGSMLPFLAMIVVIYFFMIRPQMQRSEERRVRKEGRLQRGREVETE